MFAELLRMLRENYSDYSHKALAAEWERRKLAADYGCGCLNYTEAWMAKAFEILLAEKDKP